MIYHGAQQILVPWVVTTIWIEMVFDIGCLVTSCTWWWNTRKTTTTTTKKKKKKNNQNENVIKHCSKWSLRFGGMCTVFHAFRVLIFVVGRLDITPWKDFDVLPEQRQDHDPRWEWWHVYFASILSLLGLLTASIIAWSRFTNGSATDELTKLS
jgi:hypothetical protein